MPAEVLASFSFLLAGHESAFLLPGWQKSERREPRAKGVTAVITSWHDPVTGLEVEQELLSFPDFPAQEWLLRFTNRGSENTPILSQIYALDLPLKVTPSCPVFAGYAPNETALADFIVHYAKGGMAGPEDYIPYQTALGQNGQRELELSAGGGRSSNRHFPFFNLQTGADSGVMMAVGWSGQWHARFETIEEHQLRLRAGMEKTNLRLRPGESIRTPRIALLAWQGDRIDGHNLWRRFLWKYHVPERSGKMPVPISWADTWFTFGEGYNVNEQNQKDSITGAAKMGIENLVIDAGWYECPHPYWWDGVGSWVPRTDTFPNGMQPVAEHAKKAGLGFGLWFEPERVVDSSRLAKEHPEWLISAPVKWTTGFAASLGFTHISHLLNLGLPEVQDWLIDLIDRYAAQGMTWFRHDINLDPLDGWRGLDPEDRQGMTEIRYNEGLYRVYDEIRRRHPDLFVEGCASGGRRIDLETVSRNHGYWATDMMCGTAEPMQSHIWGFNLYLHPHLHHTVLQRKNVPSQDSPQARYMFFSFLGGAPCFCFDTRDASVDYTLAKRWLDLFKEARHLTLGDFIPLTEYSLSKQVWMAYQFHRTDLDEGLVVCFRRPECPYEKGTLKLRGLKGGARYELLDLLDTPGSKGPMDANDLMAGFEVTMASKPQVKLWRYRLASL